MRHMKGAVKVGGWVELRNTELAAMFENVGGRLMFGIAPDLS